VRTLENILDIYQFTALMSEGKKSPHSSLPWFKECVAQVQIWICQDRTTSKDNLHEKAANYARNYIANTPELSSICKNDLVREVADEVEKALKNKHFDQRSPAAIIAQKDRQKIPEDPEERFIRLG